jgi:hypothetical protein
MHEPIWMLWIFAGFGLAGVLVGVAQTASHRACPYCHNQVEKRASRCPHCRSYL